VKDNRVVATHGDPRPRSTAAELRQGLLPVQDHVRRGPPDHAAAAHEERQVRQGRRVRSRSLGPGLRRDGRAVQARAQGEGPDRRRHVRLRPVDDVGRPSRRSKLLQGGLRTTTSTPNARNWHGFGPVAASWRTFGCRRAHGLLRRLRRPAEPSCCWGSNMAGDGTPCCGRA
jgi:hypothetical protein